MQCDVLLCYDMISYLRAKPEISEAAVVIVRITFAAGEST